MRRASDWSYSLVLPVVVALVAGCQRAEPLRAQTPAPADAAPAAMPRLKHPFPGSRPAPSLDGGVAWINAAGPIDLKDLRGKFVLLDFWTYCCINCIHVLPELKKLEQAYPNELVVIGVHSAKFDTEQETQSIAEAVLRYEIEHPVVNDARHRIWNRFDVASWPSFRIIDPEGNLVAGNSGEMTFEELDAWFKDKLPYYRQRGLLDTRPLHFDLERHKQTQTPLRFPGKVLADEASGRLFIADSNHNRIVVARLDGTLVDTIGSGAIGAADGDFASAQFDHPQGMALRGEVLYVADTENHLIRKVDLGKRSVQTIAGTGKQRRGPWPGIAGDGQGLAGLLQPMPERFVGPPRKEALSSPWALWVHGDDLYIAMAGPHQIWKMRLDESEIGPYAGNGREDIVDGPLLPPQPYQRGFSSLAQPSGLVGDDRWLYVADSEGSSIRAVPFDPRGHVRTVVGTATLPSGRLFVFGDVDGRGDKVRLQHVLGITRAGELLYITDTYNHKIKVIDPRRATSTTLAGTGQRGARDGAAAQAEFYEPAGISYAAGKLYVADTNNHRIRTVDLNGGNRVATLEIAGLQPPEPATPNAPAKPDFGDAQQVRLEAATVKPVEGAVKIEVALQLPQGWKINELAPTRYYLEAEGEAGPLERQALNRLTKIDPPRATFDIVLPVTGPGSQTLRVALVYYYCQDNDGLCKIGSVAWTVPLTISADAPVERVLLTHQAQ